MGIESTFQEFGLLFAISAGVALLAVWLRQPLIVGFIAVGLLVGPSGLGLVESQDEVDLLAQMGIAILLFIVGLRLDTDVIRTVGPAALATGLGQVVFTSVFGMLICLALGMTATTSLYVAVALTFSSTIIIVKLLTEKNEIETLHGQIAVGFLLVQDLVVILVMMAITALNAPALEAWAGLGALVFILKGLGLVAAAVLVSRVIAPRAGPMIGRMPELLTLVAVAWAVGLSGLSESIGFSREIGAFLAGVALSSSPFRDLLTTRLSVFRDILLLFFFIQLGTQLVLENLGSQVGPAILLSLFVLIGNPLIVMIIMGLMGFRRRTGFLAGLTVAQISEFSLIFVRLGFDVGHVPNDTLGLVTLVGIVTIGLSTYLILYSEPIYRRIDPYLRVFERTVLDRESRLAEQATPGRRRYRVVVFGAGRHGTAILRELADRNVAALGVDFSPETVRRLRREGLDVVYGDVEDADYYDFLPLRDAEWIVCTLPHEKRARRVERQLRAAGITGKLAFTAHTPEHEERLAEMDVDHVFNPFRVGAESLTDRLGLDDRPEA